METSFPVMKRSVFRVSEIDIVVGRGAELSSSPGRRCRSNIQSIVAHSDFDAFVSFSKEY